jgi:hydrogenase nickel incorporation protein HypB
MPVKVVIGKDLLEENKRLASDLRKRFGEAGVKVVNMLSSPGAGKTSLLEASIPRLLETGIRVGVIEGDVATARDAERLSHLGIPIVQITTLGACHLDSAMIWTALSEIDISRLDLLFIENVGNLVCPSSFDLGEDLRLVVLSTTEGSDKPAKYPAAFISSQVVVVNKADLIPYTDFDLMAALADVCGLKPEMKTFLVSCRSKEGLDDWCEWIREWAKAK